MSVLSQLEAAVCLLEESDDDLDPVALRSLIDRQEVVFASSAHQAILG